MLMIRYIYKLIKSNVSVRLFQFVTHTLTYNNIMCFSLANTARQPGYQKCMKLYGVFPLTSDSTALKPLVPTSSVEH